MTSVEHMPSRILFDGKDRPKGLEFASCQACQDSTRREELAIAMFSRAYPNPKTPAAQSETQKIFQNAFQNFPGLQEEIQTDQLSVLRGLGQSVTRLPSWDFISMSGPIAKAIVQKFGMKLAVALHYELTGRIVPRGAGIIVLPYTNTVAATEGMPLELKEALGVEKVLSMGRKHTTGTFSYQSQDVGEETHTVHFAYFRQAFTLLLYVHEHSHEVPPYARFAMNVH